MDLRFFETTARCFEAVLGVLLVFTILGITLQLARLSLHGITKHQMLWNLRERLMQVINHNERTARKELRKEPQRQSRERAIKHVRTTKSAGGKLWHWPRAQSADCLRGLLPPGAFSGYEKAEDGFKWLLDGLESLKNRASSPAPAGPNRFEAANRDTTSGTAKNIACMGLVREILLHDLPGVGVDAERALSILLGLFDLSPQLKPSAKVKELVDLKALSTFYTSFQERLAAESEDREDELSSFLAKMTGEVSRVLASARGWDDPSLALSIVKLLPEEHRPRLMQMLPLRLRALYPQLRRSVPELLIDSPPPTLFSSPISPDPYAFGTENYKWEGLPAARSVWSLSSTSRSSSCPEGGQPSAGGFSQYEDVLWKSQNKADKRETSSEHRQEEEEGIGSPRWLNFIQALNLSPTGYAAVKTCMVSLLAQSQDSMRDHLSEEEEKPPNVHAISELGQVLTDWLVRLANRPEYTEVNDWAMRCLEKGDAMLFQKVQEDASEEELQKQVLQSSLADFIVDQKAEILSAALDLGLDRILELYPRLSATPGHPDAIELQPPQTSEGNDSTAPVVRKLYRPPSSTNPVRVANTDPSISSRLFAIGYEGSKNRQRKARQRQPQQDSGPTSSNESFKAFPSGPFSTTIQNVIDFLRTLELDHSVLYNAFSVLFQLFEDIAPYTCTGQERTISLVKVAKCFEILAEYFIDRRAENREAAKAGLAVCRAVMAVLEKEILSKDDDDRQQLDYSLASLLDDSTKQEFFHLAAPYCLNLKRCQMLKELLWAPDPALSPMPLKRFLHKSEERRESSRLGHPLKDAKAMRQSCAETGILPGVERQKSDERRIIGLLLPPDGIRTAIRRQYPIILWANSKTPSKSSSPPSSLPSNIHTKDIKRPLLLRRLTWKDVENCYLPATKRTKAVPFDELFNKGNRARKVLCQGSWWQRDYILDKMIMKALIKLISQLYLTPEVQEAARAFARLTSDLCVDIDLTPSQLDRHLAPSSLGDFYLSLSEMLSEQGSNASAFKNDSDPSPLLPLLGIVSGSLGQVLKSGDTWADPALADGFHCWSQTFFSASREDEMSFLAGLWNYVRERFDALGIDLIAISGSIASQLPAALLGRRNPECKTSKKDQQEASHKGSHKGQTARPGDPSRAAPTTDKQAAAGAQPSVIPEVYRSSESLLWSVQGHSQKSATEQARRTSASANASALPTTSCPSPSRPIALAPTTHQGGKVETQKAALEADEGLPSGKQSVPETRLPQTDSSAPPSAVSFGPIAAGQTVSREEEELLMAETNSQPPLGATETQTPASERSASHEISADKKPKKKVNAHGKSGENMKKLMQRLKQKVQARQQVTTSSSSSLPDASPAPLKSSTTVEDSFPIESVAPASTKHGQQSTMVAAGKANIVSLDYEESSKEVVELAGRGRQATNRKRKKKQKKTKKKMVSTAKLSTSSRIMTQDALSATPQVILTVSEDVTPHSHSNFLQEATMARELESIPIAAEDEPEKPSVQPSLAQSRPRGKNTNDEELVEGMSPRKAQCILGSGVSSSHENSTTRSSSAVPTTIATALQSILGSESQSIANNRLSSAGSSPLHFGSCSDQSKDGGMDKQVTPLRGYEQVPAPPGLAPRHNEQTPCSLPFSSTWPLPSLDLTGLMSSWNPLGLSIGDCPSLPIAAAVGAVPGLPKTMARGWSPPPLIASFWDEREISTRSNVGPDFDRRLAESEKELNKTDKIPLMNVQDRISSVHVNTDVPVTSKDQTARATDVEEEDLIEPIALEDFIEKLDLSLTARQAALSFFSSFFFGGPESPTTMHPSRQALRKRLNLGLQATSDLAGLAEYFAAKAQFLVDTHLGGEADQEKNQDIVALVSLYRDLHETLRKNMDSSTPGAMRILARKMAARVAEAQKANAVPVISRPESFRRSLIKALASSVNCEEEGMAAGQPGRRNRKRGQKRIARKVTAGGKEHRMKAQCGKKTNVKMHKKSGEQRRVKPPTSVAA